MMPMTEPLTDEQVMERGETIFDSEAVCQGCGADPRPVNAHRDPRWFIDNELVPNAQCPGDVVVLAIVRCPACLVRMTSGRRAEVVKKRTVESRWKAELNRARRGLIAEALAWSGGNVTHAARSLGISRLYLHDMMQKFGMGEMGETIEAEDSY